MGEIVELPKNQLAHPEENLELVSDCCRFAENILSEAAVKKKWRFSDEVWEKLGNDDEFVRAIEDEKIRRIRSGASKA